jgi:itaconyl-CoA hydratase
MQNRLIKLSNNHYRESNGFTFDDFEVGDIFEHRPGRTITMTDNINHTLNTVNQHPIHFDEQYARNTQFKRILVNSTLTLSIVTGMTVNILSAKAVANLGWDNIRLPHPVFIDDTLYAVSKIISKKESQKNLDQGVINVKTIGYNQDNTMVIGFNRFILLPKDRKDVDYSHKIDFDCFNN